MARVCVSREQELNELGFKERRVGAVTILDTDELLRIKLRFGGSSVTLENATSSLLAGGHKQILLNLEGVKSISAKGLGELVSTLVIVRNGGGELKLFNLAPTVRQLMQATNLFMAFGLYESEAQAVGSFPASTPSGKKKLNRAIPSEGE
jgi:anti-anti-sigma factor